jgi:RimJ/RimL family protein N-acetyltransferase
VEKQHKDVEIRLLLTRRDADPKSLAAITVLSNQNPERLPETIDYFRRELGELDPERHFLVAAYAGAELVGFSRFVSCPGTGMWWCRGLEVIPEWQRRGIGTRLLKTGLKHLVSLGVKEVRSATSPGNRASEATHAKAGFRLFAREGEDFDGQWRDNRLFFQWTPAE